MKMATSGEKGDLLRLMRSRGEGADAVRAATALARRLSDAMAAGALSAFDLAAASELSFNTIDRALKGDPSVGADDFQRLLHAAGMLGGSCGPLRFECSVNVDDAGASNLVGVLEDMVADVARACSGGVPAELEGDCGGPGGESAGSYCLGRGERAGRVRADCFQPEETAPRTSAPHSDKSASTGSETAFRTATARRGSSTSTSR